MLFVLIIVGALSVGDFIAALALALGLPPPAAVLLRYLCALNATVWCGFFLSLAEQHVRARWLVIAPLAWAAAGIAAVRLLPAAHDQYAALLAALLAYAGCMGLALRRGAGSPLSGLSLSCRRSMAAPIPLRAKSIRFDPSQTAHPFDPREVPLDDIQDADARAVREALDRITTKH